MFAKMNGIRMQYQLQGPKSRPAVILIHGFPFTAALWKPQLKALAAEFRILSYDLRGMGKSALGPAPQPLEAYADDLFALMEHLGLKSAALCGLSMGGYIALRAVQRSPERFWALALCDSKADADGDEAKLGRANGINAIRDKGARAFSKGMLPKLLAPQSLEKKPAIVRSLLAMMNLNKADGMANALAAMAGRSDTHAGLRAYPGPVLALAGSQDALIPPALSKAMAGEAKQGSFVEIAEAGHVSNLENPAAFNSALLDFLSASK